jgi:tetrahydromethanopterin S-methyltransferase subunit G
MMEAMREAWTDERLDDLNHKVDEGFRRVDARFDAMQEHLDRRFEAIDKRLDGLQRTLIVTNTTFVVGLLGLFATQI